MRIESKHIKIVIGILVLIALYICIFGISLKEAKMSVKAYGTDVEGTFTGIWSPLIGGEGTFTATEGWIFEGIINPDGGLYEGELTNYPIPLEWRLGDDATLPEFYTGSVEENILIDAE